MTLPNFLVIGAARSGSTALFDYLSQHPQVYASDPKEPHYFAFPGTRLAFSGPGDDETINRSAVTDPQAYQALFAQANGATAIGEGSVSYLYYEAAVQSIRDALPDARLVCMLRNPADRAFSAFQYVRARTFEPLADFRQALDLEAARIEAGWHHIWHYRRMGYYAAQLQRFFEVFDPGQIRIYRFEDFARDPVPTLRDCFGFLGVDPDFRPGRRPMTVPSGEPRARLLQRLLLESPPGKQTLKRLIPGEARRWLSGRLRKANLKKAPFDPDLRQQLLEDYREDIAALGTLTGRSYAEWLS